jgi:hypothetical protein
MQVIESELIGEYRRDIVRCANGIRSLWFQRFGLQLPSPLACEMLLEAPSRRPF